MEASFRGCLFLFVSVAEQSCCFPIQDRQAEKCLQICLSVPKTVSKPGKRAPTGRESAISLPDGFIIFYHTQYHYHIFLLNLSQFLSATVARKDILTKRCYWNIFIDEILAKFLSTEDSSNGTTSLVVQPTMGHTYPLVWAIALSGTRQCEKPHQ